MWGGDVKDPIEEFFSRYDPPVAALARKCRALMRRLVPDAEEKLHPGWKTVSYGGQRKICAIAPHKAWVNLQFHAGTELDDPEGLLTGTGKSMRHVRIDDPAKLRQASLARLIRAAADHAR